MGLEVEEKKSAVVFTMDCETLLPSPGSQRQREADYVQVGVEAGLKRQLVCCEDSTFTFVWPVS